MAGFFGRLFGKKDKEKEVVQEQDDGIVIQRADSEESLEKEVSVQESIRHEEVMTDFPQKFAESAEEIQEEVPTSIAEGTEAVEAGHEKKACFDEADKSVLEADSSEKKKNGWTVNEKECSKEEAEKEKEAVFGEVLETENVPLDVLSAETVKKVAEEETDAAVEIEKWKKESDVAAGIEKEKKEPDVAAGIEKEEKEPDAAVEIEKEKKETDAAVERKEAEEPAPKKQGFFKRLVSGLTKTRNQILSGINDVFHGFSSIDDDFYEELEEILVMADIGIHTTTKILDDLRQKVKEQKIKEPEACRQLLIDSIKAQMAVGENAYEFEHQKSVVLLIGVNGVGKTTSVGKLAGQLKAQKKKVLMAAADTFRAAAIEQLTEWANRAGVEIIAQKEGSDPAAVVFDAVTAAKARNTDVLLCDTAGRLHNKKNLMAELKKIDRVITREYPDAYRETLVVLDGTTGQNALVQAKEFSEVADITGIILTKMDGTAKGGIAIAIQAELGIPVKYIGIGEKIDDLQKFHADDFVNALFTEEQE